MAASFNKEFNLVAFSSLLPICILSTEFDLSSVADKHNWHYFYPESEMLFTVSVDKSVVEKHRCF